jgi:non-specific serine/threonine protein kinase
LTETLARSLGQKHLLLVLDNCEHLLDACAALVAALLQTCPGLWVLATSRERLAISGETVQPVPLLTLPPVGSPEAVESLAQAAATQLFLDRARAVAPPFRATPQNAPVIAAICRRLDGLPLAIELAAARMEVLSPEQLAARLDDRFRVIAGRRRVAPPRMQSLRASVDLSYGLLQEAERTLFMRLSVFAGSFTVEAAEAVCAGDGIGPEEVLDLLASLVDKSLVLLDAEAPARLRHRLLETLREYAAERLAERGDATGLRVRLAAFYVGLAEEAEPALHGPEQVEWLGRLDAEHANFRAVLGWALEEKDVETALRLGTTLLPFWSTRGYVSEGLGWLQWALAQSAGAPAGMRARAQSAAADLARLRGDYQRSAALARESRDLLETIGDKGGVAAALHTLGIVAYEQGDDAAAEGLYEQSLASWREVGDRAGVARALNNLGLVARARGAYERAEALHADAHALCFIANSVNFPVRNRPTVTAAGG